MLPDKLAALTAEQAEVFLGEQAREHGFDVARPRRARTLTVVRRHVYALTSTLDALGPPQLAAAHASARLLVTKGDLVASHATAAAMYGFTLRDPAPTEPRLTEALGPEPISRRTGVLVSALPAAHRSTKYGVALTTPVRTVADCARTLSPAAAVVTADSALRAGVSRAAVQSLLTECEHWPGVRRAREVVAFADARADSALESATRWLLAQQGLPPPDLQVTICDADGHDVADVDFVWLAHRTVLETDGRLKYSGADGGAAGGGTGGPRDNALWREKRREDNLRLLGFEVVRGYWDDLRDDCQGLAERVRGAFALNAPRLALPDYGYRDKPDRRRQRRL